MITRYPRDPFSDVSVAVFEMLTTVPVPPWSRVVSFVRFCRNPVQIISLLFLFTLLSAMSNAMPKWRIFQNNNAVDIRRCKYPPLFTNTEAKNCFSI